MSEEVDLNLISDEAKRIGIALAVFLVLLACFLMGWVIYNRKSPVVKAMQPIFLVMLCFGTLLSSTSIAFLGVDESSNIDPDKACRVYPWLYGLGDTFIYCSLFTKLWRVNQVFHAARFERKVVTICRVLWPFAIFLTLNLGFLLVATLVDPIAWVREPVNDGNNSEDGEPIEGDENNTFGHCAYEEGVGEAMDGLLGLVNFVALIILCVQAYRARDVRSEFSEARGVALALVSWLQIMIISAPIEGLLKDSDTTVMYALQVLTSFMRNLSLLFFIFGPLISHQRKFRREGGTLNVHRVTGVGGGTDATTGTVGDLGSMEELRNARCRISELQSQVETLNARINELQDPASPEATLASMNDTNSQSESAD